VKEPVDPSYKTALDAARSELRRVEQQRDAATAEYAAALEESVKLARAMNAFEQLLGIDVTNFEWLFDEQRVHGKRTKRRKKRGEPGGTPT
jgi:hypothetical protein